MMRTCDVLINCFQLENTNQRLENFFPHVTSFFLSLLNEYEYN